MRTHEFVAVNHIASSVNEPGEYCIALIDEEGKLWQRSGKAWPVAAQLYALIADLKEET